MYAVFNSKGRRVFDRQFETLDEAIDDAREHLFFVCVPANKLRISEEQKHTRVCIQFNVCTLEIDEDDRIIVRTTTH
jgi:hypothetical protein